MSKQFKVLFASSEIYPFVKTGGLADVAQSLPQALKLLNQSVKLVMPAYGDVKKQLKKFDVVAQFNIFDYKISIIESILPDAKVPIWLIDCAELFDRPGNPYIDESGLPREDNAQRFSLFCQVIAYLSLDRAGLNWKPDILHCNDWHTGISCALLKDEKHRPKMLFTIHNLAYQGLFSHQTYLDLKLPNELWTFDGLEFNGQFSFIKAGIVYSDYINTVSPTYATEIQTSHYGCGLEGVLQYHSNKLSGIINGVNLSEWSPESDSKIYVNYSAETIERKKENKTQLQEELGLTVDNTIPMLSVVSRLAEQKGIDLIIEVLANIKEMDIQLVVLGSGDPALESSLRSVEKDNPNKISVTIDYDEVLAHKITAAADFFIMPSRFEPCGLNQMYSQKYGFKFR